MPAQRHRQKNHEKPLARIEGFAKSNFALTIAWQVHRFYWILLA